MDVFPFYRIIIMMVLSLLKDDMMWVAVIFYIVRATGDCHFKEYMGSLIVFVAISQILAFPFLAWISDYNSKYVATVVMLTALLELLIEIAMTVFTSWTVTEITILFAARQLLRTLSTGSLFKLLKLKLLCWLRASYSNSMEQLYFQTICMTVVTLVSCLNVLFWCIMFSLSETEVTGYYIENLEWLSMLSGSSLVVLLSLTMTDDYIKALRPISVSRSAELRRIRLSSISGDNRHRMVILSDVEEKLGSDAISTDCEYIQRGLRQIRSNHLCFHSLVSSLWLMMFLTICENVFPLFFALKNSDLLVATIYNLCGGSIEFVIEYQIVGHILYFLGSVSFLYFTKSVRPKLYFNRFIPAFCYLSIVLLIPLYFYKALRTIDNVLVSFFTVIPELLVRCNLFHSTASIDQRFVGLVSCIHSNFLTAAPLLSGILLTLNMPLPIILAVAVCFLLITSLHAASFSRKHF